MDKAVDIPYMRRAIALSRRGFPAPNPQVGCVVVRDGTIVGEGFCDHDGGPHAEVVALRQAGTAARGADAYVTLEPCDHHGRTPPCSVALIEAGVRRVVFACPDPNPKAAGGAERLRSANVAVECGLLDVEAARPNRQFLEAIARGRPWIVGKAAVSLDGRVALPTGESKWITGERARRAAQALRAQSGAVLVGRRTVELDDPLLTARISGVVNQPLRIVLDPHARLSPNHRVFGPEAETWHVTGQIDLGSLLARLTASGRTGLLVEGGPATLSSFLRQDLIDQIQLFVAPKLLGDGPVWVEGLNLGNLSQAPGFKYESIHRLGPDTELSLLRERP